MTERFVRRLAPRRRSKHGDYREYLRYEFRFRCCYCGTHEQELAKEVFEIDHFRPQKHFPNERTDYENLYYSCGPCNRNKSSIWPSEEDAAEGRFFVDPCEEALVGHHAQLLWSDRLQSRTPAGRFTIDHLRLNRKSLIAMRRRRRTRRKEHYKMIQQLDRNIALAKKFKSLVQGTDDEEDAEKQLVDLREARDDVLSHYRAIKTPSDELV